MFARSGACPAPASTPPRSAITDEALLVAIKRDLETSPFRTLKKLATHGRVFQTIDEVRDAVRDFATRYNAAWLVAKNGYLSTLGARVARSDTTHRRAA